MIAGAGTIWLALNPSVWKRRELKQQIAQLRTENDSLAARKAEMEHRRDALMKDPVALEREGRLMGLVRPGELPFVPSFAGPAEGRPADELQGSPWIGVGMCAILALLAISVAALFLGCLLEVRAG